MGSPKTLFLIDDDNDDLDFFCEAVGSIDGSIICLKSTDSAAMLQSLKLKNMLLPDLIFLDLNMPLIDGKKFLAEIKGLSHYAHIPVIIYSTSAHPKDINDARQLGASCFLTKPNTLKELVNRLTLIFSKDWRKPEAPALSFTL